MAYPSIEDIEEVINSAIEKKVVGRLNALEKDVGELKNSVSSLENRQKILEVTFNSLVTIQSVSPGNLESIPRGRVNDSRGYKSKRMRLVPRF